MPSVRMLTNYVISGKPYSSGDIVSVDSTTLSQLVAAKIADNDADALIRAGVENEIVQYVSADSKKSYLQSFDKNKFNSLISKLKVKVNQPNLFEASIMDDPPTVTIGGDNTGSTISNSVFYGLDNPLIHVSCGIKVEYAVHGRDVFRAIDDGLILGGVVTIITDASEVEFDLQCPISKYFQLVVDGKRASNQTYSMTVSAGNLRKIAKVDFGFRKIRKISLISATQDVAGIYINKNYTLFPVPNPDIKMINIIDSYGFNGYYGWNGQSVNQDLMAAIGVDGCSQSAYGATGYLARGGNRNFIERLTLNAELYEYDVILTNGGINDVNNNATLTAIDDYYHKCNELFPNALLISTGPWCPSAALVVSDVKYKNVNNKILESISKYGNQYIFLDTLTGSIKTSWGLLFDGSKYNLTLTNSINDVNNNPYALFTGSGHVIADGSHGVSPTPGTGDGNSNLYISEDGTHPTISDNSEFYGLDSGKCYISKWIYEKVKLAINKFPL